MNGSCVTLVFAPVRFTRLAWTPPAGGGAPRVTTEALATTH